MHFLRLALSVLLVPLILSACASDGGQRASTPPAPTTARTGIPAVDALYGRLDQASTRLREGRARVAAGDVVAGREAIDGARAEILDAATQCQTTPQCDSARFIAAYDALLTGRAGVGSEGFAEVAADDLVAGEDDGSPVVTNLPAAGATITLLNGRDLNTLITLNEPMKAAMSEWLTALRPNLIDAWESYQYMRGQMWPEYQRAGLPEALLFGILAQESGGKVHAVSRSGASGPLQFMPATGQRFGLGNANGFDTRFDPQLSARASVAYLNERFAQLNNDLELSIAAYNGGEGRVGRLYQSTGGKGFWDAEVYSQMPPETRGYVPMVLAAAYLFLNPTEYGLQFPRINAGEPQIMALRKPASIYELTICLGNAGVRDGWFRALRNLNPRYEPHTAIPAGVSLRVPPMVIGLYRANCIDSPRARIAADLVAARRPVVSPWQPPGMAAVVSKAAAATRYMVRRGDSLHAIARRTGCTVKQLATANGLKSPRYMIRPGQTLQLVGCGN